MKSNFEFLGQYWPALAAIGKTAESYLYTDANGCIYKLGLFGERVVKEIFAVEQLPLSENDDTQAGRIRVLKRERLLPPNIDDILYVLRDPDGLALRPYQIRAIEKVEEAIRSGKKTAIFGHGDRG